MEKKISYLIYAVVILAIGGATAFLMVQDRADLNEQAPADVKNAVRAEINHSN